MDNNDDTLVDYNEVDPDEYIRGKSQSSVVDSGKGKSNNNDWTFDEGNQSPFNENDPYSYESYLPRPPRGSIEEIQHRLKILGGRLRKDLNKSLQTDPQAWKALRRPLFDFPRTDHEHFHELGDDGYVHMPLSVMEKYLYPTLRIMQHLHSNVGQYEHVPGGVESMIVYSSSIKEE